MKYLLSMLVLMIVLQLPAQNTVDYGISLLRGLWKCDTSENIPIPNQDASFDLGSMMQIYVTKREIYLIVNTGVIPDKPNFETYHCDIVSAHATELDAYLSDQGVSREITNLRPGMIMLAKINCASFPFSYFARLNSNTLITVWNGKVQFLHKK